MAHILLLNGPNLNLLGTREPNIYGNKTLTSLTASLIQQANAAGHQLSQQQSNHEGELVDAIQHAHGHVDIIIFNPAAYTHTSLALRDALLGTQIPFIEVHISNPHAREDFRHYSYFSDIAVGVIYGLGILGYELALRAAIEYCVTHTNSE